MSLKQWLSILFIALNIWFVPLFAFENEAREFDQQKLEDYRQDPEFNYSQDFVPTDSFISVVLAYIFSKVAFLFDALALQGITPLFFRVAIIVGFIISIIIILKLKFGKALTTGNRQFSNLPISNLENEGQDFEKLLKESLENQQFKLAVRYLFLSTLLMLEQQKKIQITKWKAPYDYLKEIPEDRRIHFKQLVDLFENTWYGEYEPNNDTVDQGLQLYRQLKDA